jgi:hypothetical protein
MVADRTPPCNLVASVLIPAWLGLHVGFGPVFWVPFGIWAFLLLYLPMKDAFRWLAKRTLKL